MKFLFENVVNFKISYVLQGSFQLGRRSEYENDLLEDRFGTQTESSVDQIKNLRNFCFR